MSDCYYQELLATCIWNDPTPLSNRGSIRGDYGFAGDCLQFRTITAAGDQARSLAARYPLLGGYAVNYNLGGCIAWSDGRHPVVSSMNRIMSALCIPTSRAFMTQSSTSAIAR